MICSLILTTGMLGIAGLLGVTTRMQIGARESARSTRIAQDKVDQLMRLDFDSDPQVAVGGDLGADVANHSEALPAPMTGTLRWLVTAGPTDDLRILTVRIVHTGAVQYGQTDLVTIIRRW